VTNITGIKRFGPDAQILYYTEVDCRKDCELPPAGKTMADEVVFSLVIFAVALGMGIVRATDGPIAGMLCQTLSATFFQAQYLGMLSKLDIQWSSAMSILLEGLNIANFEVPGSADENEDPPEMPALLVEIFVTLLLLVLVWSVFWAYRSAYKKKEKTDDDIELATAIEDEDRSSLADGATTAHDLHSSDSVQDSVMMLGTIVAKRNKVKKAMSFLNQPYEGRNDKLHWFGIDLLIWVIDKFYMPIVTASCYLIAEGADLWPLVRFIGSYRAPLLAYHY
jgi:hypothetical protein